MLFTFGYGYVAFFVALEQLARRKAQPLPAAAETSGEALAAEDPATDDSRPSWRGPRARRGEARRRRRSRAPASGPAVAASRPLPRFAFQTSGLSGELGGETTIMTKAEIVQALYSKVGGFSRKESAELVDLVFEMMKETLGRGEKIKVSGFGNFVLRDKRQRPGRNPQTGQPIRISERRVLTFKASQILKQALNQRALAAAANGVASMIGEAAATAAAKD